MRIGDDVRAQHRLLTERFGLTSLALVVGGSMGAQQTYEWAVRYPEMVSALRRSPAPRRTRNDFFTETPVEAIVGSRFRWRHYKQSSDVAAGLKRHAKLWAVMGWSTEFYSGRPAALGFDARRVHRQLHGRYFAPMDPNDLLAMAWKWQRAT